MSLPPLPPTPVPGTPLGTDRIVFGDWHPSGFGSYAGPEQRCPVHQVTWRDIGGGNGCWMCEPTNEMEKRR